MSNQRLKWRLHEMGLLLMSNKERLRKATFEMVKQGQITLTPVYNHRILHGLGRTLKDF